MTLRAYKAFSRQAGPNDEGSILVIAKTSKEAKALAWNSGECWSVGKQTDLAVLWLRDPLVFALADQDKLAQGKPHIMGDMLLVCRSCERWGYDVEADGTCCRCEGYAGDVLVEVLGRWKLGLDQ